MAKPHPSEALEFVTISPQSTHQIEPVSEAFEDDGGSRPTGSSEATIRPTQSISQSMHDLLSFSGLRHMNTGARDATRSEHRMTFMEGLKLYPKAIGWSFVLSLTIVMEAYDLVLVNSFYAFPAFRRAYGVPTRNGYEITTAWQSALTNGAFVGEILGLLFSGLLTERFGYRYTIVGSLIALALFIFPAFFAFDIGTLMASQVLCGLPWGVFQVCTRVAVGGVFENKGR